MIGSISGVGERKRSKQKTDLKMDEISVNFTERGAMDTQYTMLTRMIHFANGAGSSAETAQHTELTNKKLISAFNHSSRGNQAVRYFVIHDTGNTNAGADAVRHAKYFGNGDRNASAHYFVDDKGIVQVVEDHRASWHCGDGKGRNGITNQNSIGIEICINSDGDFDLAFVNAAVLTAKLMKKHRVPLERVVRHYDASGKCCPRSMSGSNWEEWHEFKALVALYS